MIFTRAPFRLAAPAHRSSFCAPESRPYILSAAILASALAMIDGTFVSIAMPAMRVSLDASLSQAQWISNAYMLTLSALILVGGAAGDRFGVARVFATGIVVFIIASLACAVAPTAETLIAARAFKGLGAAIMVPGSLALIARAYPKEERGGAIGIWAAASALTTALGPVLGGALLTLGGPEIWRVLFAINLPLGLVALWLLLARVEVDPPRPEEGIDFTGAGLATVALGGLAWGLTALGNGGAVPFLIAGLVALGGFIAWEARAPHPMLPLDLFRNRAFSAANLATFTLYFGLSAILFFQPMLLIAGWGLPELTATVAFVPLSAFIFLFSARAGRVADRVGAGPMIAMGSAIVAVAFVALAITSPMQDFWALTLPAMALFGLGMSLVVAPLSSAVMGAVDDSATGAASGVNNAVSRIAGLVAVAAMGSVVASVYAGSDGPASYGIASDQPGHAAAMNAAFATLAWITAGLAALSALIAGLGLRARPRTVQTGS